MNVGHVYTKYKNPIKRSLFKSKRYKYIDNLFEDVYHNVFLNILNSPEGIFYTLDSDVRIYSFLKKACINYYFNQFRSKYYTKTINDSMDITDSSNPLFDLLTKEWQNLYLDAVAELPTKQRESMKVRFDKDITNNSGQNYNSLKTHFFLARKKIKYKIDPPFEYDDSVVVYINKDKKYDEID